MLSSLFKPEGSGHRTSSQPSTSRSRSRKAESISSSNAPETSFQPPPDYSVLEYRDVHVKHHTFQGVSASQPSRFGSRSENAESISSYNNASETSFQPPPGQSVVGYRDIHVKHHTNPGASSSSQPPPVRSKSKKAESISSYNASEPSFQPPPGHSVVGYRDIHVKHHTRPQPGASSSQPPPSRSRSKKVSSKSSTSRSKSRRAETIDSYNGSKTPSQPPPAYSVVGYRDIHHQHQTRPETARQLCPRSDQPAGGPAPCLDPGIFSVSMKETFKRELLMKRSPNAFLSRFDTVLLIDDSFGMWRSWQDMNTAVKVITTRCAAHNRDGIDIYFLNAPDEPRFRQIKSSCQIECIFRDPHLTSGEVPSDRLSAIIRPYLRDLKKDIQMKRCTMKPLNIIMITCGVFKDDMASVIIKAAKELDRLGAPPWQVGILFYQADGRNSNGYGLRDMVRDLDKENPEIRDMVDVSRPAELDGQEILNLVSGAVRRRLDC